MTGQKIKLDDKEYEVKNLSDQTKVALSALQFVDMRMNELKDMQAIMHRAKNSYIEGLKAEMLSAKSGLFLEDD
jgi:hypothetical protein